MNPQLFALLATAGALFSFCVNAYAAWTVREHHKTSMFRLLVFTAVYSLFYVGAWGVLAADQEIDRATWSETVTPFSLTSFFTVWVGAAALIFQERNTEGIDQ